MGETVSIPKEEYEFLKKCEEVLYEDSEEKFSESFIRKVKKAQKQLEQGKGKTCKDDKEMEEYLNSL